MKYPIAVLTLALAVCGASCTKKTTLQESQEGDVIPQARPIVRLLKAVKNSDVEALKTVWSEHLISQVNPSGADELWKKILDSYKQVFEKEFGEYEITDFKFEFKGDVEKGKVVIIFRDEKEPDLLVVKEGNEWKVNER